MSNPMTDKALALAAVFQEATLVEKIATKQTIDEAAYNISIDSIFTLNTGHVSTIFDGQENLGVGLDKMSVCLANKHQDPHNKLITQYAISLLTLERKLNKKNAMRDQLRQRIVRATEQAEHFGSKTHDSVIASLAETYLNTLSTFKYRIQVKGDPIILQQAYVVNKIRALLLAGIRAAVLWRQVGGNMWQLLFFRKNYLKTVDTLLDEKSRNV